MVRTGNYGGIIVRTVSCLRCGVVFNRRKHARSMRLWAQRGHIVRSESVA